MIKAKDAKTIADSCKSMDDIDKEIRYKAHNGFFRTLWTKSLSSYQRQELVDNGYEVEDDARGHWISWEEDEV